MRLKPELHIVIDNDGVKSVQIIGPPEIQSEGHNIYFKIRDLIPEFNKKILNRINGEEIESH